MDKCSEERFCADRAGLRGDFSGAPFFLAAAPLVLDWCDWARYHVVSAVGSTFKCSKSMEHPGVRTPRLTAQNRCWERGTPSSAVI